MVKVDGVVNLNIPTGTPLVYEFDDNLKSIKNYYPSIKGKLEDGEIPKYLL